MLAPALLASWTRIQFADERDQVADLRRDLVRPSVPRQPTWVEGHWSAVLDHIEEASTSTAAVFVPARRRRIPRGTRLLAG